MQAKYMSIWLSLSISMMPYLTAQDGNKQVGKPCNKTGFLGSPPGTFVMVDGTLTCVSLGPKCHKGTYQMHNKKLVCVAQKESLY